MVTWPKNIEGKIEIRLDGKDMMVPEEDCVWTKKDGKLHHIHTLGEGFSLFEFEGLTGTFEERLQQVKDNRAAALTKVTGLKRWKSQKEPKKSTKDWPVGLGPQCLPCEEQTCLFHRVAYTHLLYQQQ